MPNPRHSALSVLYRIVAGEMKTENDGRKGNLER